VSRLIGTLSSLGTLLQADEETLLGQVQKVWADWTPYDRAAYFNTTDYFSEYFPAGVSGLLGDVSLDVGVYNPLPWGAFEIVGGATSALGIIGITRDQYGTPVGACVVQLFLTSTDALVIEGTSDANGNFLLTTPFTGTHYIVAYKAASPDIFGTTVNTLVGA
jgi:hypothetical protein